MESQKKMSCVFSTPRFEATSQRGTDGRVGDDRIEQIQEDQNNEDFDKVEENII